MSRESRKLEPGDCVYSGVFALVFYIKNLLLPYRRNGNSCFHAVLVRKRWKDTTFWFSERIVHLGGASHGVLSADLGSSAVQMKFLSADGLTESLPRLPRSCEATSAVNSRLQCAVVGCEEPIVFICGDSWLEAAGGGGESSVAGPRLRLVWHSPRPPPLAGLAVELCAASPVCHSNKCLS